MRSNKSQDYDKIKEYDMNDSKRKMCDQIAFMILGIFGACLFIRSFYSFSWSDESYYLTVAHRFWLGERMIADEWFTTQLNTPLLLPFYALYQKITGGNEGIYLYFRLIYLAISMLAAVYTYWCLRKKNSFVASLCCSLIYLLYSRANIGGMSYYNLTLTFMLIAVLLIAEGNSERKYVYFRLYFAGIFLALATVNTPFLSVPYLIIMVYLLVRKKYCNLRQKMLIMISGISTAAIIYMSYVLSRVSVSELILNVPYILSEPEMQRTNPLLVVPLIFIRIAWRFKWTIWATVLLLVYIWNKKRKNEGFTLKQVYKIVVINMLIFVVNSYLSENMIGCINIAGVLFLLPVVFIFIKEKDKSVSYIFVIAGASMLLGFSFSSDTGLDALAIGFVLLVMGMVLLTFQIYELKRIKILQGAVLTVICIMIFQTAILRFFSVYRDAPLNELNMRIEEGPAKFLYTTEEHVEQYYELKDAIEKYVREDDVVFYSKTCFWSYLCSNNSYGTPSSWRMPFDSPRLELYYKLKPEKVPSCIFVLKPEYGGFESSLIQGNEKVEYPNDNNMEGYLYDYIIENNYELIQLECATIYRRKQDLN